MYKFIVASLLVFGTVCRSIAQDCPPNEVRYECGSPCEPTCDDPDGPDVCTTVCNEDCVCRPYYYRNNYGYCVLLADC